MIENLQTNRYGVTTPNLLLPNGITIATPIYFNLPTDTAKGILNSFREAKLRQLVDLGWEDTKAVAGSSISVTTNEQPPMTPLEQALGMTEEALRYALFTRSGVQERLILRLQELLDINLVSREEIEQTYTLWLDEFNFKRAATPRKTTRKPASRSKVAKA